jgi:ankyrin repeat protein
MPEPTQTIAERMARITLLLAAGADVTFRDRDGETALMTAQRRGDAIIVQLLKSAGAEE